MNDMIKQRDDTELKAKLAADAISYYLRDCIAPNNRSEVHYKLCEWIIKSEFVIISKNEYAEVQRYKEFILEQSNLFKIPVDTAKS